MRSRKVAHWHARAEVSRDRRSTFATSGTFRVAGAALSHLACRFRGRRSTSEVFARVPHCNARADAFAGVDLCGRRGTSARPGAFRVAGAAALHPEMKEREEGRGGEERRGEKRSKKQEARGHARSQKQEARSKKQEARSKTQDARSKKQEARSQKQEARSKKQEARSQKPEARSKKQEARSKKPEARIKKPQARSHKQEAKARSQEQEARSQKPEARRKKQEARSKKQEARGKKQEARSTQQAARSREKHLQERSNKPLPIGMFCSLETSAPGFAGYTGRTGTGALLIGIIVNLAVCSQLGPGISAAYTFAKRHFLVSKKLCFEEKRHLILRERYRKIGHALSRHAFVEQGALH